jgi:hypothetical protein
MVLLNVMAVGTSADGASTLEGLWPWEPWRLLHGQHLGRVLLVDADLLDAVHRWISEPWTTHHPHLAVQLFCAAHGVAGGHLPTPLARLSVTADPSQAVPADIAARCRQLLT